MSKKSKTKEKKNTDVAKGGTNQVQGKNIDVKQKLGTKEYEAELFKLQVELVKLQDWVKKTGARIVIVFEGRDAAGKRSIIKRILERLSPRVFRLVALPAPTERQKTQLYAQRYVEPLPAGGEIVIFDRSWYNRAGVEPVMGFCTEQDYEKFLTGCPAFEDVLISNAIILLKHWLDVSENEQHKRFLARIEDPSKRWKLSSMDLESHRRAGTTTRERVTPCSLPPILLPLPGTLCLRMIRNAPASTASPIFSVGFRTRRSLTRLRSCPVVRRQMAIKNLGTSISS